jgi:hypothetical protein
MSPYRKLKRDGLTVYEHRVIVANRLGRALRRDEHVHHKNEQKSDNSEDNLEIKSPKEHARLHMAKHPEARECSVCGMTYAPLHRGRDKTCGGDCRSVEIMHSRLGAERFLALRIDEIRRSTSSLRGLGRLFGVTHITIARICAWPPPLAEAVARSIARALRGRSAA